MEYSHIVLGTRGSELARAQALLVEKAIRGASPDLKIETRIIATKGDQKKVVDFRAGRKGLFTAEIERALIAGEIDFAVHSAKDLPSEMDSAAEIGAALPRASVSDVLVSKHSGGLGGLPHDATVATGSVRRKHQLHWKRPDLAIVDLRGNVPTRVQKLAENDWDAIVLARAGLDRLQVSSRFFVETLSGADFLPAGGQGIIAIQIRAEDENAKAIATRVNDPETFACLQAEREFLRLLNVDCNAPVGVLATIDQDVMKMRAQFFEAGSPVPSETEVEGRRDQGELLAKQLLERLRARHGESGT